MMELGKTFKEVLAVNWTIDESLIATSNCKGKLKLASVASPLNNWVCITL